MFLVAQILVPLVVLDLIELIVASAKSNTWHCDIPIQLSHGCGLISKCVESGEVELELFSHLQTPEFSNSSASPPVSLASWECCLGFTWWISFFSSLVYANLTWQMVAEALKSSLCCSRCSVLCSQKIRPRQLWGFWPLGREQSTTRERNQGNTWSPHWLHVQFEGIHTSSRVADHEETSVEIHRQICQPPRLAKPLP